MSYARPISIVVISILVFAGGFFFLLRGCLSKYDERSAIPSLLYFEKDGKDVLFALVKFDKTTSYSRNGGFVRKSVSSNYYIQTNDATTGEKIDSRQVKSSRDIKHHPVRVLGASATSAWLFLNEPMAFDPFTLEKVADIEILEAKNPELKGKFSPEQNLYNFNSEDQHIYFTALDGTKWKLDTKTLAITSTEDITNNIETAGKQLENLLQKNRDKQNLLMEEKLRKPSQQLQAKQITMKQYQEMMKEFNNERIELYRERDSLQQLSTSATKQKFAGDDIRRRLSSLNERMNLSFGQVKVNQDTIGGKWYGLYTGAELEKLYNRVQHQAVYEQTARRTFYTTTYAKDQNGDFTIAKNDATVINKSLQFLDGGLLLNKTNALPLKPGNGNVLVVYKNQVGNEGVIQLALISLDGKMLWTIDTKLKEWNDYLYTGKKLFVLGTDNKELSSSDSNLLWLIDLSTGKATTYDYFKDK